MTQDQQIHPATYHHQPSSASDHAFPILAFAVVSIMGTVLLLVAYYVFVNKFSSNWHHLIILPRWISVSRSTTNDDSFIALSPTMWNRGLDESIIRKIPTFQYTRRGDHNLQEKSFYGCVVCLNEFQEQDMLRILPNCSHSFHLDCIDIWFQRNANCPLCRTNISGKPASKYPPYPIVAPSSSPQSSHLSPDSLMSGDDDYVVIELGGEGDGVFFHNRQEGRGEVSRETQNVQQCRGRSPAFKMEQKPSGKSKSRNGHHVSIMGDECIDVRGKDDQFCIEPIRRSFSLDSAVDRQLYSSVQAIIRQNRQQHSEITTSEGIGSNRVGKSLMFPFGHSGGSRKVVLPVEFDL